MEKSNWLVADSTIQIQKHYEKEEEEEEEGGRQEKQKWS